MSTESFKVSANTRSDTGTAAMRRMRKVGQVPGVIYGGASEPANITVAQNEMMKHLDNEAFYSHILTLTVEGQSEQVLLKDLQRHPFRQELLHVDFLRVVAGEKLTVNVPLHFINEEAPVKLGGRVQHTVNEIEIKCLPSELPEFIEVDLAAAEIGTIIHMSDLKVADGIEIVALSHGDDQTVANVATAAVAEEDEEAAGDDEAEAPAE